MAVTQTIQDQVTELYVGFFGRAPDAVGMGYWAQRLSAGTANVYTIANEFSRTPEFISNYGPLTPTQQVTRVYQNVLDRAPDAGGLAYWVGELNAGVPIGSVVYNIVNAAFSQVGTADGLLVQNKVAVGEYFAITLASNDTAVAQTAYNGVTSAASSVVAKEAELAQAVAPTYTLTTNIDTVPASGTLPAYAKVTGVINAGLNDTYNTGDTINGTSNGHDRVDVTIAATNLAAPLASINNVDVVNFRTLAAQAINAQLFSGVQTVSSASSTNILTVANGEVASTYALANTVAGSADGIAVAIRASDVTGANTTANFRVASVGTASTAAAGLAPNPVNSALSQTATGVENVVIDTAGNNVFTFTGSTAAATDTAKITITGAGNNTITIGNGGMATTSTVTAATATGLVNLNVGTNMSTNDTFVGGKGTTDILRATLNGVTATGLNVSAFETFRIDSGAAVGTASFAANPAFSVVREDAAAGGAAAGGVRQLLNAANITTLNLVGGSLTAGAAVTDNFSGLTVTGTYAGAADTLTVNVSNGGVAHTAGGNYNVANAINTTGVESYVVNVADTTANAITTTFAGVVDASMTNFSVTSNGNVIVTNLGTVAGAPVGGVLSTVDFSNVSGTNAQSTVTIANNSLAAATVVTAGASGLSLTTGAESVTDVLTFNGSTAIDTLVAGFTGIVVANGGGGVDTLSAAAAASSILNGGAGGDFLTGSALGTNSITGGSGADTLTLGAGVDTLIYDAANQGGAALTITAGGALAAGDTALGFAQGAGGDVLNFNAATTTAVHAASVGATLTNTVNTTANAAVGTVQGSVYVNTTANLAGAAPTVANVSALIGNVVSNAGDSFIFLVQTNAATNIYDAFQVTTVNAHAGTALATTDTISLVGTYTAGGALTAANIIA